jgi:uncharacterized protein (UPF0261 family)
MALEELVKSDEVSGVLDITASEVVNYLLGGIYSAGPNRLEAAGLKGVPQLVSPGAFDIANFGPRETVPEKYKDRGFYFYTPSITLMRTSSEENALIGRTVAEKLNQSRGPTTVLIPLRGFSLLDREGARHQLVSMDGTIRGDWYDREADLSLVNSLKRHLDQSKVFLKELDLHINDPQFAQIAVELLEKMLNETIYIEK